MAAVLALLERARSGLGQHVDVARPRSAAMQATQSAALNSFARAPLAGRSGGGMRGGDIVLRFVYPALDGHVSITHVFGAAVGPATRRLMELVHEEGFCDEATRDKDWVAYGMQLSDGSEPLSELDRVQACIAALTSSQHQGRALRRGPAPPPAAGAGRHAGQEVLLSEQLESRDYWDELEGLRYPGPWAKTSAVPLRRLGPAPKPGEHDGAVLAEWAAAADRRGSPGGRRGPADRRTGRRCVESTSDRCDRSRRSAASRASRSSTSCGRWPGPTVSRLLADAGATVVRVESATKIDAARAFMPFFDDEVGVEHSALFNNLNAGKLGVTLDLRRPEARAGGPGPVRLGRRGLRGLLAPGHAGLGARLRAARGRVNPQLVMMSTCLFGQTGPLSQFAGYGNLAAGLTGFYGMAGWPDRDPVGPYGAYTDYTAPHLAAGHAARRRRPPAPHRRGPVPRLLPGRGVHPLPQPGDAGGRHRPRRRPRPAGQPPGRPLPPRRVPRRGR